MARTVADERKLDPQMGERMRRIRNAVNLTQAAFATLVGSTAPNVANWEKGMNVPSQAAQRITKALPWLTMDYIYTGRCWTAEEMKKLGLLELDVPFQSGRAS